ncbi:bifunctional adenosylcobinamide kinase/adenosylcobinamide-phosphate guanylyltransferase [Thermodesulfobacteriota bacterium]
MRENSMGRVVLVTGGSRSGKSEYARKAAEQTDGPRIFVATCPEVDDETRDRIRKHRLDRSEGGWDTIEEEIDLAGVLRESDEAGVILVDCLTLWINNLMFRAPGNGDSITEEEISRRCKEVLSASREIRGKVFFVTNEVGLGIVPENEASRLYRDLVGRCNQTMAEKADQVIFTVSGLPLTLK